MQSDLILGFADVGIAWQVTDFEETDVEKMMDRLYIAIRPFYQQLHAYVRHKLIHAYPNRGINSRGHIPVHLLGEWTSVCVCVDEKLLIVNSVVQ